MRAGEEERGEDRQVREGFECARQTASRKGREGKFLTSRILVEGVTSVRSFVHRF
jgi:hypothetical protein